MSFRIRKRNLNKSEQYACGPVDVKKLFSHFDMHIDFGSTWRSHQFDSRDYHHPRISGIIIAAVTANKRGPAAYPSTDFYLDFYVIRDESYDKEMKKAFVESYLSQIVQWCNEMLARPETAKLASEHFLVELQSNNFHIYKYKSW